MRRSPGVIHLAACSVLAALSAVPCGAATLPDNFADSLVVGGLDYPVGMAFLPDGRLVVIEQKTARIQVIANSALVPGGPAATLPDVEITGHEQGLLGIAVDPRWPARPYLYVHLDDQAGFIRISRYTASGDLAFTGNGAITVDPASRHDLVSGISDINGNHNGGTLRFGPDGRLYDSLGEDALFCPAQDTTSLLGVILRLDVSRLPPGPGSAPRALVIPPGNPFAAHPDSNARLVWSIGLRNPFRFHIDPTDGALHIGDVGANDFEEIDREETGGSNFGWPLYEGPAPTGIGCGSQGTAPIHAYDRSAFTAAVIDGGVYRAPPSATEAVFPEDYEGNAFFSDYYAGFLRRLVRSGPNWSLAAPVLGQPSSTDWGRGFEAVSDWLVGPDGALWFCKQAINFANNTGQIRRIVNVLPPTPVPPDTVRAVVFLPPRPNPAIGDVRFRWRLPQPAAVEIAIFDPTGRRVRTLNVTVDATPEAHWDGTDTSGNRLRPGFFVARFRAAGVEQAHRFALLR